jgi:Zn-dependent protease/predicted transcriptional regulator
MRGEGFRIGRIFGIPIFLHTSWFLVFLLITYSFVTQLQARSLNLSPGIFWGLGLFMSILFFGSLVFHEMAHSLVARYYKIPVVSITLFVFGGVARIARDPSRALEEFNIAVAGPLSSFLLAASFWTISRADPSNQVLYAVTGTLAWINLSLAVFNLIPGFPLDGGRIFRAIVWAITKNFVRATRIAGLAGQTIAFAMIGMGFAIVVGRVPGGAIGGLWIAFIGWFLLTAARQSQAHVEVRSALEPLQVSDIMTGDLPVVGREISLEDYAREVAGGHHAHLVVAGDQLVGLVTAEKLQAVPREEWDATSVQAVMVPKERLQWAAPEEPALSLLERMQRIGLQQIPVISAGSVVGLVTRDSILRVLQGRQELRPATGR